MANITLPSRYTTTTLSILSSTRIHPRVTAISNLLKSSDEAVVILTAKVKSAGKLISISEIVKRGMAEQGTQVHQYSALGEEIVELGRGEMEEEDKEFEVMGEEGSTKKRAMPTMTIYLSCASVAELKEAYGEQKALKASETLAAMEDLEEGEILEDDDE